MIDVCLLEFVRTGRFGPIELGINRNELKEIIGDPDQWGLHASVELADIWKYGDIEFHFNKSSQLYMIFADNFDVPRGNESFRIKPWIIREFLDAQLFKAELTASGIEYRETEITYLHGCVKIETSGCASLQFRVEVEDEDDHLGLYAFNISQDLE